MYILHSVCELRASHIEQQFCDGNKSCSFESHLCIVQASMQLTMDILGVPPCGCVAAIVVANMSADSLLVVLKHTVALPNQICMPMAMVTCMLRI
jgi:hypothetical protein